MCVSFACSKSPTSDGGASDPNFRKPWEPEEDQRLKELVGKHGVQQWAIIASEMNGRNSKQCRERWHNQLDNQLNKAGTPLS